MPLREGLGCLSGRGSNLRCSALTVYSLGGAGVRVPLRDAVWYRTTRDFFWKLVNFLDRSYSTSKLAPMI